MTAWRLSPPGNAVMVIWMGLGSRFDSRDLGFGYRTARFQLGLVAGSPAGSFTGRFGRNCWCVQGARKDEPGIKYLAGGQRAVRVLAGGWVPGPIGWLDQLPCQQQLPVGQRDHLDPGFDLSLIHISEPTRRTPISYAVF